VREIGDFSGINLIRPQERFFSSPHELNTLGSFLLDVSAKVRIISEE
jgi:hypothetical protein